MKNLTNLNGVKTLSKNEQKTINGGKRDICQTIGCLWICVPFVGCVGPTNDTI